MGDVNQRINGRHATDRFSCWYPCRATNETLSFTCQVLRLAKASTLKSPRFQSATVCSDEDKVKDFSSPMIALTGSDADQSVPCKEPLVNDFDRQTPLEPNTGQLRRTKSEPSIAATSLRTITSPTSLLVWVAKEDGKGEIVKNHPLDDNGTGGCKLEVAMLQRHRPSSQRSCAADMMMVSKSVDGGLFSRVNRLKESHGKISFLVMMSCLHSLVGAWQQSGGGVVMAFVPTQLSENCHRDACRNGSLGRFVPASRSKAGRLLDIHIGDAASSLRPERSFFWPAGLYATQDDEGYLEGISSTAETPSDASSEVWREFEADSREGVQTPFVANGSSHKDTNGESEPYSNGKTQPCANGVKQPHANGKHQEVNGKYQEANVKSERKVLPDVARVDINQVNGAMKNNHDAMKEGQNSRQYQPIRTDIHGGADVDEPVQPVESHPSASTEAPELHHWTSIMADGGESDQAETTEHGRKKKPPVSAADSLATAGDALLKELEALYPKLADMSEYDNDQVDRYWARILPTVKYLEGERQIGMVRCGLRVAYRAHRGQMRKSGEPFIVHPVEVLLLLSALKMDAETLTAAILHDTVEDTDLTFGQIEHMFGHTIRNIVEGETKVSKLPKLAYTDFADEQAENLRQMFVAMTDDYRIIFVKLADRLHNMRTLRYMKKEKQIKISRETLDIFAPLAHRMGIWQFKSELEDTAFMYLHPAEYKRLHQKLRRNQTQFRRIMDKSRDMLIQRLEADSTLQAQAKSVKVFGRTKELYSLWHKMTTNSESELNQISDVVGLRVIVEPKVEDDATEMGHSTLKVEVDGGARAEVGDKIEHSQKDQATNMPTDRGVSLCYHVLGLVRNIDGFQPIPTKFKDYISLPKVNGYQSLHTAVMLDGQTIEVQIRTAAMHHVAEFGMASYWASTQNSASGATGGVNTFSNELYNTPWLSSIKEWKDDVINARDFVECVRKELLGKRVFVFLRNGKILNLPRGSSVVDAAFQIHTEVALGMHGALINGNAVPFSYELKNGDVVSILTGKGQPAIEWMRYAKSRSTRSKLRSYFRKRQKESLRKAGEILLFDFFETHRELIEQRSYLDGGVVVPTTVEEMTKFLPGKSKFSTVGDLLIAIGSSHDRSVLQSAISKIFRVPLTAVVEAEVKKSGGVRRSAIATSVLETEQKVSTEATSSAVRGSSEQSFFEVANKDNLCVECLPVRGDDVIGTKSLISNGSSDSTVSSKTVVHRVGCKHAQRALDKTSTQKDTWNGPAGTYKASVWEVSGVGRSKAKARSRKRKAAARKPTDSIAVKLEWGGDEEEDDVSYLAEVCITAADRKMLLADCSSVVSRLSDIMKTGSSSSDEGAKLEFLVRVKDTEQLQNLIDDLEKIESVTGVERRFGSTLL